MRPTLAVIIVGYRAGIIDEYILNGTIILILITCIVASVYTQNRPENCLVKRMHPSHPPPWVSLHRENFGAIANPLILVTM